MEVWIFEMAGNGVEWRRASGLSMVEVWEAGWESWAVASAVNVGASSDVNGLAMR